MTVSRSPSSTSQRSMTPILARELEERHGRLPRYVCSIDEFELLLLLGDAGHSIPLLVDSWQNGSKDYALGARLEAACRLTPVESKRNHERIGNLLRYFGHPAREDPETSAA
jgi:hypothetical protein